MFLRLIIHSKLADFLFGLQKESAEFYLKNQLENFFLRIKRDTFEISPPKNFLYLNKILENFKTEFSNFLGSSPPPFSFILSKNINKVEIPEILRAGKIYMENSLKDGIASILEAENIFYKIIPWKNLWEIVLPSTVDPKIEVFYKDLFWVGKYEFCLFCKTTWHPSLECPSFSETELKNIFQSALQLPFKQLSQFLWEGIYENNFSYEKLKYFYVRNFYILPEFLKLIFFASDTLQNWSQFKIHLNVPIKGGKLGLGVEYLMRKELENARIKFLEASEDPKANLGLALIEILKKDYKNALYYVEEALNKIKTPFLKSYFLFLKGYLHELIGFSIIADEFYKAALEIDFLCLPAFYYLSLSKYKEGKPLSEIIFSFNHPYLLYWSYLEPLFIKEQRSLEEYLYEKIFEKQEEGTKRLKEAEDRYHKIKVFFSEKEKKEYEKRLSDLRESLYKGSLDNIEKASQKALEIDLEFQGYIYKKIKSLQEALKVLRENAIVFQRFWQRYPYKYEDITFGKDLKELWDLINKINIKIKRKDPSDILSILISEIDSGKQKVENLKIQKEKLIKKWNFRMKLANFLRNFTLSEIALTIIYIILPYFPGFKNLERFLTPSSFLFFSFILLIIFISLSYLKHYE